jgi:hypothetical protein
MQNEIVALFRAKENAETFASKANPRFYDAVRVEKRNGDRLWEVRLIPKRRIVRFERRRP